VCGLGALITRRAFVPWRLVKDATRRLRTVSLSIVPTHAFNATPTSLELGTHDFA